MVLAKMVAGYGEALTVPVGPEALQLVLIEVAGLGAPVL